MRRVFLLLVILAFVGAASAEDPIFGNISTFVVTNTSATIIWECPDTPVRSQIEYGLTMSYGSNTTEKDFSYWRMTDITELSEDTTYHYRIRTIDLDGNSVISDDYNFTTINSTVLDNIIKSARNDGSLPKTYYVATWGNDTTNDGLSLGTAWESPYHASITVDAGDTIWVVNGSYNTDYVEGEYDPGVDFSAGAGKGIAEAPITMKAYNGTPNIIGDIELQCDYITFDGFICKNSYSHGIDIRDHVGVKVFNCEVHDSGTGADGFYVRDALYTTIENCTVRDAGWNAYGFKPSIELPATGHHIAVKNCSAYDSFHHNLFDTAFDYMIIEDCTVNNSLLNSMQISGLHNIVNNLTGSNAGGGIKIYSLYNSTIMNCTLDDSIWTINFVKDIIIYNNYISQPTYGIYVIANGDVLIADNEVYATAYSHRIEGYGNVTIRDDTCSPYKIWSPDGVNISIEFTDDTVFTEDRNGTPVYYPDRSNFTFNDSGVANIVSYNITLRPTRGYLHDVAVNTWDEATDTYRITADSTEVSNPTWMNISMQNDYSVCEIYKDGILSDTATICADKIIAWSYSGEFTTSHDFRFERRYGLRSLYMNNSSPISITTSATENNMTFSRLPDRNDDEITSFKLVVKTS